MALMQALALLAGGAAGHQKRKRDDEDQARRAEDDAFRREQRDRQRTAWKREDQEYADQQAERDAVKAAAAPTVVDDAPVAVPIGSRDEPRAPEDQGIRAAGRTFTDRAAADAAAAEYNAPATRMRRAAAAMSDPVRAGQLETTAQNSELGAMQMRAAKLKEADEAFNRDLVQRATSFDTLASIINESKGDGQNGGLKVQVVPSADGKTVALHKMNPDGTTTPTPFNFANTTEGLQQAVGIIGMRMPPEQKLAHMQGMAKSEEERRRWGLEFGLKETDVKTRAERENRMARAAEAQAEAARRSAAAQERAASGRAAGNQAGGMTIADLRDGHKSIASTLNADYKTQIENAPDDKTSKAIKTAREQEIADVQRIYTGAMQSGFALTPEQAIVAYRVGERAKQSVKTADGTGTFKVEGVLYQGKFIPMADVPGASAGSQAAPVADQKPAATGKSQPPATPSARQEPASAQKERSPFALRDRKSVV